MRPGLIAILLMVLGAAPAEAQHFDLEMSRDSVKLGEVVELQARIHIGPQQTLAYRVPVVAEGMPDGGRVVGVDSLEHQADRTLLIGKVRMACLRTGRVRIPPLRVIVKATPDDRGFMLESEPLYVDVVPTLPAGSPSLKDIRKCRSRPSIRSRWPLYGRARGSLFVRRGTARRHPAVAPVTAGAATPPTLHAPH
jgi:hypothetical protein